MIPEFLLVLPLADIYRAAEKHGVAWDLLAAICSVESNGDAKAMRYEPGYRWLSNPAQHAASLGITHETETQLQMHSMGLCQLMGATLRDLGYLGPLPLLDPVANLEYGAKFLRSLSNRGYDEVQVVAAYNAGSPKKLNGVFSNQRYVDKVFLRLRELRALAPD